MTAHYGYQLFRVDTLGVNNADFSSCSDRDYIFLLHFPCCSTVSKWLWIVIPVFPENPTQHRRLRVNLLLCRAIPLGQNVVNYFYKDERYVLMFPCVFASWDSRIYEPAGLNEGSSHEQKLESDPQALLLLNTQRIILNKGSNTKKAGFVLHLQRRRRLNVFDHLFVFTLLFYISYFQAEMFVALDAKEAGFWRQTLPKDWMCFVWIALTSALHKSLKNLYDLLQSSYDFDICVFTIDVIVLGVKFWTAGKSHILNHYVCPVLMYNFFVNPHILLCCTLV